MYLAMIPMLVGKKPLSAFFLCLLAWLIEEGSAIVRVVVTFSLSFSHCLQ